MLYQLHHVFPGGTSILIAQANIKSAKEYTKWARGVMEKNPAPEDALWRLCDSDSDNFYWEK
jgi:hypothetical protein